MKKIDDVIREVLESLPSSGQTSGEIRAEVNKRYEDKKFLSELTGCDFQQLLQAVWRKMVEEGIPIIRRKSWSGFIYIRKQ